LSKNRFAQICAMARALMVVQVFRSLYCLRVQMSTPMNEQNSVHWWSISNWGFRWPDPFSWKLSKSKLVLSGSGVYGGSWGVYNSITAMRV
jgi:hypothetical protein